MALENLSPIVREERLLAGEDLDPVSRLEYFLKQAGSGGSAVQVPTPAAADNGKVLTANNGAVEWKTLPPVFDFVIVYDGSDLILKSGNYNEVRAKLLNGFPVLGVYSDQATSNNVGIEIPINIELGTNDIGFPVAQKFLIWDNENNLFWD